jgi:hypothetical protein
VAEYTVQLVEGTVARIDEIQVPLFVTIGDKVKVDTRTGDYLGRV